MKVLVLNCGSSSVKYRVVEPRSGIACAWGLVDRVGQADGHLTHSRLDAAGNRASREHSRAYRDHEEAVSAVLNAFAEDGPDLDEVAAVGHRVVHGGQDFSTATVVDHEVLSTIDRLAELAPLHNPPNATGIRIARQRLPDVPHVAVFDTAFHSTIPDAAATYALPLQWRTTFGVRRYGFHGISHAYVSREAARFMGLEVDQANVIVLHLGNGASACAVRGGQSIDTSMGMTPLAGLVMGTRSGDVDPAVLAHMARVAGLSPEVIDLTLNTDSGLLGLTGASDLRDVIARADAGEPAAQLGLDVYCYRVRSYVGSYFAALGKVDAVIFTGGVGENASLIRTRSLEGLEALGIQVDPTRNDDSSASGTRSISRESAPIAVLIVPTDEELEIALQTLGAVEHEQEPRRPRPGGIPDESRAP